MGGPVFSNYRGITPPAGLSPYLGSLFRDHLYNLAHLDVQVATNNTVQASLLQAIPRTPKIWSHGEQCHELYNDEHGRGTSWWCYCADTNYCQLTSEQLRVDEDQGSQCMCMIRIYHTDTIDRSTS